ncbi:unnamed protein product [Caenorhabditis sp. 36 PRJEB53466]|nr:unnamed protein product [Caenorhabditis sp. 36 PRJEB53466]
MISDPHIDEEAIRKKVDSELKKGGTFDKIRKQATEHIRESSTLERIEKEMLEKVDEIMKSWTSNSSREEMQRKLRDALARNDKVINDINRQTRIELDKNWVNQILDAEIEKKISKIFENHQ